MCGILGQINSLEPINEALFTAMLNTLAHRGPDDAEGYPAAHSNCELASRDIHSRSCVRSATLRIRAPKVA